MANKEQSKIVNEIREELDYVRSQVDLQFEINSLQNAIIGIQNVAFDKILDFSVNRDPVLIAEEANKKTREIQDMIIEKLNDQGIRVDG